MPVAGTPGLFTTQFDANDPVHTPNGLNIANPAVEQSFADAVSDLRNAGIPLDAPLRDWQYERRGSERIPIHGGPGGVGRVQRDQRRLDRAPAPTPATRNVPHGSSFVMVAQFTDDPDCPVDTRTILTYSQSTNPIAVLRRPDAHVLQQGVGGRALLRGRDRGRPEPRGDRIADTPAADLAVTNEDLPDPVSVGQSLTYTVRVTNNGPFPATGVILTDQLDRSLRLRSARSTQARCALRKRSTVRCNFGNLAVGEGVTATIVVRTTRRGPVTSTATAADIEPLEFDPTNNVAIAVTTVTP